MIAILLAAALALPSAEILARGGNAGVCVTLDAAGHVTDATITESSGDATVDNALLDQARRLHWDAPYPDTGRMAIRLGVGEKRASDRPAPPCPSEKSS